MEDLCGTCDDDASNDCPAVWSHAKAILDVKCSGCHTAGNSGGWNTGSYESTQADADDCSGQKVYECMLVHINSTYMPMGKGCSAPAADGDHSQCLSAEDIAVIQAWVDNGGAEN